MIPLCMPYPAHTPCKACKEVSSMIPCAPGKGSIRDNKTMMEFVKKILFRIVNPLFPRALAIQPSFFLPVFCIHTVRTLL